MHILLTADTVGGVWTYARELAAGLVRRGVQVTLVSFGEIPEPRQMRWMEGLRNFDFRPTAFRLEWMQDSETDIVASSEYLRNVIREVRPDVLHLNQYCYGTLDVDIPKLVVAHSDVVSWWNAVHGDNPPESDWSRWYRETVRRGLAAADTVVAPSRWMLAQIAQHYGKPRDSAVIFNGRTPQTFNPHGDKEDRIVSVGRLWDEAKQVSLLTRQNLGCAVTIAGALDHPDRARRGSEPDLSTSGRVELKSTLNPAQVQSLLARASIYAATSRYEPFGLAPLEAALSRCAILANDISSFREIWGETACYFRADEPGSLLRAVSILRRDPSVRRKFSELAYQRARRLFTADRMVEEYIGMYNALVPQRTMAA